MSPRFESEILALQNSAIRQALGRLRTLRLIDGDAIAALTELIADAIRRGERNQENLILYAMGRFQSCGASESSRMSTIVEFMAGDLAFDPAAIESMSKALDDVCQRLCINGDARAREVIAIRIIELARQGERNPAMLRDKVLAEASKGSGR